MKKIIVVTAVALGMPATLIIAFLAYLFVDMNSVENLSKKCSSIIPAVEQYRNDNGAFPKELNLIGISEQLKNTCNYQIVDHGYIFALSGSMGNLQAYIYNSERNMWFWD